MYEQNENINTEIEIMKRNPTKLLDLKSTLIKMKKQNKTVSRGFQQHTWAGRRKDQQTWDKAIEITHWRRRKKKRLKMNGA